MKGTTRAVRARYVRRRRHVRRSRSAPHLRSRRTGQRAARSRRSRAPSLFARAVLLCGSFFLLLYALFGQRSPGLSVSIRRFSPVSTPVPDALPVFLGLARTPAPTDRPYAHIDVLSPMPAQSPFPTPTSADRTPRVFIYHTHATEAYRQTAAYTYRESDEWRTKDERCSVVAIGRQLCEALEARGVYAIHDASDHEPPKLSTAYSRSEIAMRTYRTLYPSLELFIDVHRDAYADVENGMRDVAVVDGAQLARLMFVVGTGEGATGTGFAEMPDFSANLAMAEAVTQRLLEWNGHLARPVRIKTGRYNQHIGNCLLVEVGHNANTFEQASASVAYLADAIVWYMQQKSADEAALEQSVWTP